MEDKSKIIHLVFLLLCLRCSNPPETAEILSQNVQGEWILKTHNSNTINAVYVGNKRYNLDKVIDLETFNYLYTFKNDSIKIENPYYYANPYKKYYKDKENLYFLIEDSTHYLKQICKIDAYEVLGGPYLRIHDSIYWKGKKLDSIDLETFRIEHVTQNKSEWKKTIGIDKNYIYNGNNRMSQKYFETLFWNKKDSIRLIYY